MLSEKVQLNKQSHNRTNAAKLLADQNVNHCDSGQSYSWRVRNGLLLANCQNEINKETFAFTSVFF